jgi:signal transduction histidine kinase
MKHAKVESPTVLPRDSLVPLASILCTEELNRRPARAPDYQAENRALVALAQALADSPRTILQRLAQTILEVFRADSAGLSLLTEDEKSFYWPAIAGMWQPHIGGGTPRDFGPCGDVLDHDAPMLFTHWERRYPYLLSAMPLAEEGLLVPFYVDGRAVGTIWAIAHGDRRKFDAEDLRQLVSLGSFASSAYQVVAFLDALEQRDEALRQCCEELEQRVVERTTQLMRASEALREAQAELAHVNRVTTMGQLAASITHEVNQPLAGMVTNAGAGLRWLDAQPPNLEEVRQALSRIIKDGERASDVIGRIRALIQKAPPRQDGVEINEAIREVIALTQGEVVKHGVSVQTHLAAGLPLIQGDRVQLQQVLVNLILNAVEAMSGVREGSRALLISTGQEASGGVLVTVQDSGPGLHPESVDRLFDAFYTTKPGGMGMGLPICRSIVEAHGGRIWISRTAGPGATVQFTLPLPSAQQA